MSFNNCSYNIYAYAQFSVVWDHSMFALTLFSQDLVYHLAAANCQLKLVNPSISVTFDGNTAVTHCTPWFPASQLRINCSASLSYRIYR